MDFKKWFICTVKFYSATKKNKIMAFAGKWIKLEIMMLSKVKDHKDKKKHIFSHFQTLIFNFIYMYEVVNISHKARNENKEY